MKTLIVCSSITGNTRLLANTINDLLPGHVTFCSIDDAPAPVGYDLVALGFWLQGGKPDLKSARYLAQINEGTKLFLFATHGAAADSQHALNAMNHAKSLAQAAKVIGTFNCPGEVNETILESAQKKDPQPPWLKYAAAAVGHPNEADIARLKKKVRNLVLDFLA
jgi:flavodoxin